MAEVASDGGLSSPAYMSEFEKFTKLNDKLANWRKQERQQVITELLDQNKRKQKASVRAKVQLIWALHDQLMLTSSLLDVGCGTGILLQYLILSGHKNCQGIEPMEEQVQECRRRELRVRHMSVYGLGRERTHYQGIMLMDVLEHLQWPERALSIVAPICKQLWITTPYVRLLKTRKEPVPMLQSRFHLREWSKHSLTEFVLGVIGHLGFSCAWMEVMKDPRDKALKQILCRFER